MSIAKWLKEEIEAVTPRRDGAPRDAPIAAVPLDDDAEEVRAPPIRTSRQQGPTVRERVLQVLRQHGPIAQREVWHRVWRQLDGVSQQSARTQSNFALDQLEQQRQARRCRPPADVPQHQVWWEVVE